MATFAERLREALAIRHMTAAELSRRLNVNEGTISQYKSGLYEPKQKRTHAIAEILRVSIPWLMGGDVPMEPVEEKPLPKKHYPVKESISRSDSRTDRLRRAYSCRTEC